MKKFWLLLILLFFSISALASPLVKEANLHIGKPYIYAAEGPNAFDCSGFTYYCVDKIYNIQLLRSAYDQGYDDSYTKIESIEELVEGDLVYFNTNLSDGDLSDHAGIYIGNNQFIHASSAKGKVIISDLSEGYYNKRFSWGRRIVEEGYNEPYQTANPGEQLETRAP